MYSRTLPSSNYKFPAPGKYKLQGRSPGLRSHNVQAFPDIVQWHKQTSTVYSGGSAEASNFIPYSPKWAPYGFIKFVLYLRSKFYHTSSCYAIHHSNQFDKFQQNKIKENQTKFQQNLEKYCKAPYAIVYYYLLSSNLQFETETCF